MTPYEIIKTKCDERLTSVRKLELALNLSNGYIKKQTAPMSNYGKAKLIADFLEIPVEALTGHPEALVLAGILFCGKCKARYHAIQYHKNGKHHYSSIPEIKG